MTTDDGSGEDLLIAEIGASSSRWAFVSQGETAIFPEKGPVPGFNPLNADPVPFIAELRTLFEASDPRILHVSKLRIYGAGCGTPLGRDRMREALRELWPKADMTIETDLLGAARGLCQNTQGLVLILGTGMNVGYFNGSTLHTPLPSLGYILGDEGSGADIGRVLLQDAFYRRMPIDVKEALFGSEGPVRETELAGIYGSQAPARALAAYTGRLATLQHHSYVRETITGRFMALVELLQRFFPIEQRREVYATGSVAFGFKEILAGCLLEQGMSLVKATKDPLLDLVSFERQR